MSFSEISLSYVYEKPRLDSVARQAGKVAAIADALPWSKRKAILKVNLILIAGLAVYYMYLSGTIVSGSAAISDKTRDLDAASRELDVVRAKVLTANTSYSMGYFKEQGYYETKNLNVIKRTDNVAAEKELSFYQ